MTNHVTSVYGFGLGDGMAEPIRDKIKPLSVKHDLMEALVCLEEGDSQSAKTIIRRLIDEEKNS